MQSLSDTSAPRKRRRTAKSCEQCRHRKVGCDQAHPCGPCRRSRDHLTCTYRDSVVTAPAHVQPGAQSLENGQDTPNTASAVSYPHETSRFEVVATGVAPATRNWATRGNGYRETDAQTSQSGPPPDSGTRVDEAIHRLEDRIQRLEAEVRNAHRRVDDNVPVRIWPVGAETSPRLRFTKAKVKLFAQSHWIHTAEKVRFQIELSIPQDGQLWMGLSTQLDIYVNPVEDSWLSPLSTAGTHVL